MIDPAVILRLQFEAEREYRRAVEHAEQTLAVDLPRFRAVEFLFSRYKKPSDLGQAPFYRRFPGLTAKPYWASSEFPGDCRAVLERFEDESAALRDEFEAGITTLRAAFSGAETGYFGVASTWLSYDLVTEAGQPIPEAMAAFPRMGALIKALVDLRYPCRTYFALMMPGVHLEPHCGGQNNYLRMHFALRIPPGDTGIRVGGVQSNWHDGKELFFDDTFVHEAWNRTEEDRYILLMRILHPELSPIERTAYFVIEEQFTATAIFRQLEALKSKLSVLKD